MVKEEHVVLPNRCEGFLYEPANPTEAPGCVIVFHERYGLVRHTLDICRRLAGAGYIALAPDLFSLWPGDKAALRRGEARAIVSDPDSIAQLDHWIAFMRQRLSTELKIVLMGVCQSGRYPIVVAAARQDVTACIVFYGAANERDWVANDIQTLPMPAMITKLETPMLFVFAEQDHTISLDNMTRIRDALETADLSYRMKIVPEVPHGFLNDTMPGRYRPEQAEAAWGDLLTFLHDVLIGGWPHGSVEWQLQAAKSKHYDFKKNVRME